MNDRELFEIFTKNTADMLDKADKDDFSALVNALSGIVMYPRGAFFDVLSDDIAFADGSDAAKVFATHNAGDDAQIKDTYFARGFYDGFFRVVNKNEEVNPKNILVRMRHAMIHTRPIIDMEEKTIAFNDTTKFTDVGFWNKDHYFAKDRRNPHNNHKIERIEEFTAKFTFEEFRAVLKGYCDILPAAYPVSE